MLEILFSSIKPGTTVGVRMLEKANPLVRAMSSP